MSNAVALLAMSTLSLLLAIAPTRIEQSADRGWSRGNITVSETVEKDEERLRVRHNVLGRSLVLRDLVAKVRAVEPTRADGVYVVFGELNGHVDSIDLVDFKAGGHLASFEGIAPVLSPGGDYLALRRFFKPGDPNDRADYLVIPIRAVRLAADALQKSSVYPKDGRKHLSRSVMQWVAGDVVAFLDYYDEVTSIVAVQMATDGSVKRVVAKPLPSDEIVDRTVLTPGAAPAKAISDPTISRLSGDGLELRLSFPARAGLKVRRIDVRLW